MAVAVPAPLRRPGLDVIRAFAILFVMAHHFRFIPGIPGWFEWFALRGYVGVDLFFVLSGWLIGGQLIREARTSGTVSLRRFWARRWFRTLPTYYAVLVGMLLIGHVQFVDLPSMLVFAQNYTTPLSWIITWSLCIEEHFYLLLPLAMLVVLRLPRAWVWGVAAAGVLLSPALRWAEHPRMAAGTYEGFLGDFYSPTHLRLDGLLLGVAMAALAQHRVELWRQFEQRGWWLAAAGLALIVGTTWNPWLTGWTHDRLERMGFFAAVPGFLTVSIGTVFLLPLASRKVASLAAWRPFVWIAEHAYTLYLSHEVAGAIGRRVLRGHVGGFWMLLLVSFAASFLGAALLRKLVEEPGLRVRDRILASDR